MAHITIYDATESDKSQLAELVKGHTLDFVDEPISTTNLHTKTEILTVFVSSSVTAEIIEKLPKLKLIICRSTGYNNVDLEAASAHKVTVTNVPSYGDETVAEYAFGMLLSLTRNIIPAHEAVQSGRVALPTLIGSDLHGKTLGVVGAGRIGRNAARIGVGFGMKVVAYDLFPDERAADDIGYEYTDLDSLLMQSDVISLHAPYTGDNYHLIDAVAFKKMKKTAILVNTARGELVETEALVDALTKKHIAGAALDVVEGEKMLDVNEEVLFLRKPSFSKENLQLNMALSILAHLPNVVISPHNAFNTVEAVLRINTTTAENIEKFLKGKPVNVIHKPKTKFGTLYIARHGESEWNALGVWTGTRDVHLTENGFKQAAKMGQALADYKIDYAFCSKQIRALETMENIFSASQQFDVPYDRDSALNERDYGDYTGKNKEQMKEFLGDKAYKQLRRGWDYPVPNGETLKDVYARVEPFYLRHILPVLKSGKNVLIVSHGNAIRSLMKYIESFTNAEIADVEMIFDRIVSYEIDEKGKKVSRTDIETSDSTK
jgi:D-lactate dehydrogenase